MTGFGTGLLGMDAFYSVSFRCAASVAGILLRIELHSPGWTLLSFKLWLEAWEPTGEDGVAVLSSKPQCRPISRNLERTCAEKLEVKTRNKLHTSSIRMESVLKFMRNMFPFPFIPHSDVIFQQISKYKPHASNKKVTLLHLNRRQEESRMDVAILFSRVVQ